MPSLVSSSQLVNSIASNLTAIGSTVSGVGQTISEVSVLGVSPFVSVATTISSLGPPIQYAGTSLQNVSDSINAVKIQTANSQTT